MTASAIKNGFNRVVDFLNQPAVKEGIKNVTSTVAFAFGLVEVYDIYQIVGGREISTEADVSHPQWMQIANKVILLLAKISLLLSAATSRPGVFILSTLLGQFFSNEQLESVFGPNTVFEVNPWHPRHIGSIAAVALALPSCIQSSYRGMRWVYDQFRDSPQPEMSEETSLVTDSKVHLMALFNTLFSRPAQHLGNQARKFAGT